jgi:hypothetical protein
MLNKTQKKIERFIEGVQWTTLFIVLIIIVLAYLHPILAGLAMCMIGIATLGAYIEDWIFDSRSFETITILKIINFFLKALFTIIFIIIMLAIPVTICYDLDYPTYLINAVKSLL